MRLAVVAALMLCLAGGCSSDTGSLVTFETDSTGVWVVSPPNITFPPPGSPGGAVRVSNPCEVPVTVELRLGHPGEEAQDPAAIRTVKPGRSVTLRYVLAEGTGPWDVVVTAPDLGWAERRVASEDHTVILVPVDPGVCPGSL